jgi:uncharacterized protein (TIGR02246 family)
VIPFLALAQVFNLKTDNINEDALAKKYDEADNNNDAAALAALFTEDAVIVPETGPVNGREAIEKWYADLFQKVHDSNHVVTVDQDSLTL